MKFRILDILYFVSRWWNIDEEEQGEKMRFFMRTAGIFMIPLYIYFYVIIRRLQTLLFGGKGKHVQRVLAAVISVLVILPAHNLFGFWALIVLHFLAASAIVDIIRLILKKAGRSFGKIADIAWRSSAIALGITAAVLGYAYWNMHHVVVTEYTVSTEKEIRDEGYNIVFLSDLHFGTTMDLDRLQKYCKRIEEEKPDLVLLGGDIVDESSTMEEVKEAFGALGQVRSTYGTYYVYGNHDKGRYSPSCDFTERELAEAIEEAGVKILEDETVQISKDLCVTGRRDRSDASRDDVRREAPEKLLEDGSKAGFCIVADHQPREMEENAAAGYDLMLSGHTHAGQMWPVGLITTLFDKNTFNYGRKNFGDMELIVSSGIGGWGYAFRTGKHSEIVVVHVEKK